MSLMVILVGVFGWSSLDLYHGSSHNTYALVNCQIREDHAYFAHLKQYYKLLSFNCLAVFGLILLYLLDRKL